MTTIKVEIFDWNLALVLAEAGFRLEARNGANGFAFVADVNRDGALRLAEILLQTIAAYPPMASHLTPSIALLLHFAQAEG